MRGFIATVLGLTLTTIALAQDILPTNSYTNHFNEAYQLHPDIPKGLLEAIAWHQTHFRHLDASEQPSCIGLPRVVGVMGLTEDGHGYFLPTLARVAKHSPYTASQIRDDARLNILAYASVLDILIQSGESWKGIAQEILALSELPTGNEVQTFARESQLYSILNFLNDPIMQQHYGFPNHQIDLEAIFGKANLDVLSSKTILIQNKIVQNSKGKSYQPGHLKSADFGPAIWNPAPSCNYSSRSGTPVSAITVHTIQGSYAGAISWAQNCNSNVSYHYVIRSSDGQVTQMVDELDKAWHVGSENPYTIGYEHEGYVSDPSWYTTAMYTSSSDLSRDVTNSGYGISPLRTYYGASSSGTNTLGACTQIKGHQHYPNQSHTDPGINWDWERYYQLINNAPSIGSQVTTTGTYYDSGGSGGNYGDDERSLVRIEPPGATSVTLSFSQFDVELNWDYLYIYDGPTTSDPVIGIYTGTNSPGVVTGTTGVLLLEFRSDCATTAPGWAASWTSIIGSNPQDNIAPTTNMSIPSNWQTTDFPVTFNDADNTGGSGLAKQFYQVINYDGVEWRANADHGFFSDNFDLSVHPDWTNGTGIWGISNSVLQQSDETNSNTNIYAATNQNQANQYLYHWAGRILGSGTNRRAGFHFFSDDGSLPNRGNSYFVWFRLDDAKIQIYETINDVFQLEADLPFTFVDGQWYDFKVIYDKTTGTIEVYVDDVQEASWTDLTPLTGGDYLSFRSGDALYEVNNLKVYRSRTATETISVGSGNTTDIYLQNIDPLTSAAKVKSIVTDSAGNISGIAQSLVNVDWTPPSDILTINDGLGPDVDTTTSNTELSANWTSSQDIQSDLARYWYAIGSTPGGTDIVNWTDNWFNDTANHTGLNLNYGATYYFTVKAENGAGLESGLTTSDGIYIAQPTAPPTANFNYSNTIICQGDSVSFTNSSADASSYQWTFIGGSPASSNSANPTIAYSTSGTYDAILIATGPGGVDTLIQSITINVDLPATAAFTSSADTVYLPNAIVFFTNQSSNANGYSWDFGDSGLSNDFEPFHQYAATGVYTVALSAFNTNCPAAQMLDTITVLNSLGIDNQLLQEISIAPNPRQSNDTWWINLPESLRLELTLHDARGRLIGRQAEQSYSSGLQPLPDFAKNLTEGLYLLNIRSSQQHRTIKLIVE